MNQYKKIVLAYSGGLDTSVIIPWLKENYANCEVIAVAGDVGQGADELEGLEEKAIKTGASKLYIEDLTHEFVNDYIFPALKAGAKYETYLLGTALARPILGKRITEIAIKEGADAIAHGCTGKGNDQVRFELAVKAFAPDMPVIAPWRVWELEGREDELAYAKARNIPLPIEEDTSYSKDRNLWHLSHEGLDLEDPANEPDYDKILELGVSPEKAPDQPTYVSIDFEKGIPVALNGQKMDGVSLIQELNQVGGANGIGILDLVENRLIGMKCRGVYETPGGAILYYAHELLEMLTLDKDTAHFKEHVALKFAELTYNGLWYTPLMESLQAFVDKTQETVTGTAKIKLYKGNMSAAGITSPYTLYSEKVVTFGKDSDYDQMDSQGFVNLYSLPTKVRAKMKKIGSRGRMKLWAGRTKGGLDERADHFNSSISFDYKLLKEDLQASKVHAEMLARQGIVSKEDGADILKGLTAIQADLEKGTLEIDWSAEDLHTFIEAELTKRIGEAGKRVHTGRSRNDQVATATKLYAKHTCDSLVEQLTCLITTLHKLATKEKNTILPGYTHLQRAQPVTFGHHLLAYAEMFLRDRTRVENCKELIEEGCPLGSGALAGTIYPIDRHWCAEQLGFRAPTANSIDGVSDRDYCIELLHCASLIMMHLSRFSEEIILWCSWEFRFVRLDDGFSTGSSIMPQKKNPDIAELVRGKTGRVYGNLMGLLTTMKSLPLAYNKDMQEDKEAFFNGMETVLSCLNVFAPMLESMQVLPENMKAAAAQGFINATDCADYLVEKGLAFRDAYHITGQLVAYCIEQNTILEELPLAIFTKHSPLFEEDVFVAITLTICLKRRASYGAPADIERQLEELAEKI